MTGTVLTPPSAPTSCGPMRPSAHGTSGEDGPQTHPNPPPTRSTLRHSTPRQARHSSTQLDTARQCTRMVTVKEPPTAPDSRPRHSTSVSGLSSRQWPDSGPTVARQRPTAPDTPTVRAQHTLACTCATCACVHAHVTCACACVHAHVHVMCMHMCVLCVCAGPRVRHFSPQTRRESRCPARAAPPYTRLLYWHQKYGMSRAWHGSQITSLTQCTLCQ